MRRPLFAIMLASFLTCASAQEKTTSPVLPSQKELPLINPLNKGLSEPPALSKAEWLKKNKPLLTQSFCKSKSLIRNCFLIDDKQCQDFSKTISESCFSSLEKRLPDSLTGLDQRYYGKLVKACSYDLFEKLLIDKRVPHPDCRSLGEKVVPRQKAPPKSEPLKSPVPTAPLPQTGVDKK
ncbi:MAG: hypothetical protein U1E78_13415 [Gammaproteobacteria bacterium]